MTTQVGPTVLPAVAPSAERVSWAYVGDASERDLRVDFMRGLATVSVVIVHVEFFSLFNFLFWERIGSVSSAEFFVVLSGFVLGQVSLKRVSQQGLQGASWKIWDRAVLLYRNLLAVNLLAALVAQVPIWDTTPLTTFVDRGANAVYSLYPGPGTDLYVWIGRWLLLRMGPYQVQVLGLYTCFFVCAPAALYLLSKGRVRWLLTLSWVGYFAQRAAPSQPTGAMFEYAFPLLTWQVLFVHGLAAGYHREQLLAFYSRWRKLLRSAALVLAAAFCFFALNSPNRFIPEYARLSIIPEDVFSSVSGQFFSKEQLGLLRLLNIAVLLVVCGELLTCAWVPLRAGLGWFFIPLGQASLYIFTVHVPLVLITSHLVPFGYTTEAPALLRNTVAHMLCLAVVWLLVRYRVLFRWIPH
ncbi:OpgC domain-containing protein [Hyalangium versicolor]|uniref:OpgC domain-containing protein n=1 Tax=Hyalangium versicolor TaxID=2861190 RepID=UPI001CCB912B|nr:OpgC domain-containing protein [Hyalangium versicolor]